MSDKQGFYAVLQFSPAPEGYEFINVGVVLFVPSRRFVDVKLAQDQKPIEKLFGKQDRKYINVLKSAFAERVKKEFSQSYSIDQIEQFSRLRANNIRLSKLLPIVVDEPIKELEQLFQSLVGELDDALRRPKVATVLRKKFEQAGVAKYVQKPDPIALPQGVTIETPFGYQNGAFNLIDAVRLGGDPKDALATSKSESHRRSMAA